jgi:hypothetical protein
MFTNHKTSQCTTDLGKLRPAFVLGKNTGDTKFDIYCGGFLGQVEMGQQHERFREPAVADFPLAAPPPAAAPVQLSSDVRCVAKLIVALKKRLAEEDLPYQGSGCAETATHKTQLRYTATRRARALSKAMCIHISLSKMSTGKRIVGQTMFVPQVLPADAFRAKETVNAQRDPPFPPSVIAVFHSCVSRGGVLVPPEALLIGLSRLTWWRIFNDRGPQPQP